MTLHDLYNLPDDDPKQDICPTCRCLSCEGCDPPSCEDCGEDFEPSDEFARMFCCERCAENRISSQDDSAAFTDYWEGGESTDERRRREGTR